MSTFTNFAVVASGKFGKLIIEALASITPPISVVVLSRSTPDSLTPLPSGVKSAQIDYAKPSEIADTLKEHKIQVVISVVGAGPAVDAQKILAEAAKSAGVQLFAPSEFGLPTTNPLQFGGIFAPKAQLAEHLQTIGLPSLRIFNGIFYEHVPWLIGYPVNKKANLLPGADKAKVSFIAMVDVAGFVAHVTTTLPLSQLSNKTFRIHGSSLTLEAVATKLGIEAVAADAVPESAIPTMLQKLILTSGKASVLVDVEEVEGELNNSLWQGHQWKTVEESVKL